MSTRPGTHVGICFSSGTPGSPSGCRKCSTPKTTPVIAINMPPTMISLLLPRPRDPSIAFAARIQPPAPNDISRKTMVQIILLWWLCSAPGKWIIATKRNIMIPNRRPDQRSPILVAMRKDADSNAKPTKYTQNKRQGMYEGTTSMIDLVAERCSAPKTASGTAKHRLLKATILSRPRAWAISFFEANTPIKKTAMPAENIATGVGEISKSAVRIVGCIDSSFGSELQTLRQLSDNFAMLVTHCQGISLMCFKFVIQLTSGVLPLSSANDCSKSRNRPIPIQTETPRGSSRIAAATSTHVSPAHSRNLGSWS